MSDPLRLRILKKLTALIERVGDLDSNSDGDLFRYSLTGKVFRGRGLFGDDDVPPFVALLEDPTPLDQIPQPIDSTSGTGLWTIAIQGFCKDDPEHPLDPAYLMSRDVVKVLADEKQRIADVKIGRGERAHFLDEKAIMEVLIGTPVHRPPDGIVSASAYFYMLVTFRLAEKLDV